MARIRTIKPEFFLHEEVAALSPLHRLLFVGLWTLADKRGVLEDKPRRIKASLFPWDNCDVDAMLWDLVDARLILRYDARKADGEPVEAIAIPGFQKHQRPHPKETAADINEPDLKTASREKTRQAKPNSLSIPSSPAGKESWEGVLDSGKEVLDPPKVGVLKPVDPVRALGGFPAPASVVLGAEPDRRGDGRPWANANDTLEDKFARVWEQKRGRPPTRGWFSENALRPAFEKANGDEHELLRVFAAGLDAPYPLLTRLADLARHYDMYAATKGPEPRARGSPHARATDADKVRPGYEAPSTPDGQIDFEKVMGV